MRVLECSVVFARLAVVGLGAWLAALVGRRLWITAVSRRPRLASVGLVDSPRTLAVSEILWRGPVPSDSGYRELLDHGVERFVDLREEAADRGRPPELAGSAAEWLLIGIKDGRVPGAGQLAEFGGALGSGRAYVHCQAGEGRTGAIIGAYEVSQGRPVAASISDALSVGPLSFSQLVYIATAGRRPRLYEVVHRGVDRPTAMIIRTSRRAAQLVTSRPHGAIG